MILTLSRHWWQRSIFMKTWCTTLDSFWSKEQMMERQPVSWLTINSPYISIACLHSWPCLFSHDMMLFATLVVRKFQDFEAPFLTIKQETGTCRVAVRKTWVATKTFWSVRVYNTDISQIIQLSVLDVKISLAVKVSSQFWSPLVKRSWVKTIMTSYKWFISYKLKYCLFPNELICFKRLWDPEIEQKIIQDRIGMNLLYVQVRVK